ncbi:MAG: phytanoyl-CoA dioxygenase family protein [Armatimonadota bacterium]
MPTATSEREIITPRTLTEEEIRFYQMEGYVVLRSLLTPDASQALYSEVMNIMEIIGLGHTKLKQSGEYLPGSGLDTFINSSVMLSLAEALMGGESTLYMPFTAVKSGGGGGEFHFHQDNQYTRFDGPGINLWTALSPMTEENGCLKVVPRSHLHGTLPSHSPEGDGHRAVTFEPEDFVSVSMDPGDCIAFSRLTVHGSGPNISAKPRVAYAVQYHRDDVNYSLDSGETWTSLKENPRWKTRPVDQISIPKGKIDGH